MQIPSWKICPQGKEKKKSGFFYQNDDSRGRPTIFKALKGRPRREATKRHDRWQIPYEPTDPTVFRPIVPQLNSWCGRFFFNEASPKFSAQALIRKAAENRL